MSLKLFRSLKHCHLRMGINVTHSPSEVKSWAWQQAGNMSMAPTEGEIDDGDPSPYKVIDTSVRSSEPPILGRDVKKNYKKEVLEVKKFIEARAGKEKAEEYMREFGPK